MNMEKIKLAKIINTHGIKGEVKLALYTDFPFERFKKDQIVILKKEDEELELVVKAFRMHKEFGLLKFKDYNNINDVLSFKNYDIYIKRSDIKSLASGYYFFELKNLKVYDEANNYLGTVSDVRSGIKLNYLVVSNEKKDYLVPYNDFFIKKVNLNEEYIIINKIEGLFWGLKF